jgi:hypothetical protein
VADSSRWISLATRRGGFGFQQCPNSKQLQTTGGFRSASAAMDAESFVVLLGSQGLCDEESRALNPSAPLAIGRRGKRRKARAGKNPVLSAWLSGVSPTPQCSTTSWRL